MNVNRAQSILELVAMIMFIASVIFIGGPTIIRGVNAHFKIWDESVQDSFSDPLHQAPISSVNGIPTNCVCDTPIGGPGTRCSLGPCPNTQRLVTTLCNPVGCGTTIGITEEQCIDDPACCDIYRDTSVCGTGGAAPDCPVGQRVTQRLCGSGISRFGCRPDSAGTQIDGNVSCTPHCIGTFNLNETEAASRPSVPIICPGDNVGPFGGPFIQDASGVGMALTFVGGDVFECNHPPAPGPNKKCEVYCIPSYRPWVGTCVPAYSSPFNVAGVVVSSLPPLEAGRVNANDQSITPYCFPNLPTGVTIKAGTVAGGPGCFNGNPSGSTPGRQCQIVGW
ncbi:MAG: hypothetical protein JNN05_04230 [Candidatus Omnitrophica bacterium]|nr:hypothetical protein [Candidatus Omnitrophota bacterium]